MLNYQLAEFESSFGLSSQLPPPERVEIAFAGRSNVGKSSLLNKLFNRKALARVSSMPGKTATINFYALQEVRFVDLPGYGYAKVAKTEKHRWAELIEGYFDSGRNLALVVLLIDMRHPPSQDDLQMIEYLVDREMPFMVVLTKADKLSNTAKAERLKAFETEIPYADQLTLVPVSAQTGAGMDTLKEALEEALSFAE